MEKQYVRITTTHPTPVDVELRPVVVGSTPPLPLRMDDRQAVRELREFKAQANAIAKNLAAPAKRATVGQLLGMHRTLKLAKDVKPGRNAPCPCGSGKKFKHCHGGSHE